MLTVKSNLRNSGGRYNIQHPKFNERRTTRSKSPIHMEDEVMYYDKYWKKYGRKPANAFLLFMATHRRGKYYGLDSRTVVHDLAKKWDSMSMSEKKPYYELYAQQLDQLKSEEEVVDEFLKKKLGLKKYKEYVSSASKYHIDSDDSDDEEIEDHFYKKKF
jgi:hypothetical protein